MTRMVRMIALAIALLAIFGGIVAAPADAEASNGYERWVDGFSDGCLYYWDGYVYTVSACPRIDGGFDFYVASSESWVFYLSAGQLADGGTWVYYGGQYYYGTTISSPNWSGLTDNVAVNQIIIDSNNAIIDNILAPNCIETYGNTCYY